MKQHSEEQIERLRQQLEDAATELLVKEKELKKLKLESLMKDTQQTFANLNVNTNLNNTVRHHTTYNKGGNKPSGEVPGVETNKEIEEPAVLQTEQTLI